MDTHNPPSDRNILEGSIEDDNKVRSGLDCEGGGDLIFVRGHPLEGFGEFKYLVRVIENPRSYCAVLYLNLLKKRKF